MTSFEVPAGLGVPVQCCSKSTDANPAVFTTRLTKPISNDKVDLSVSLLQATLTYHVNNITAAKNNNIFKYQQPMPNFHSDWKMATSYSKDDEVLYEGKRYLCVQDISGANPAQSQEPPDATLLYPEWYYGEWDAFIAYSSPDPDAEIPPPVIVKYDDKYYSLRPDEVIQDNITGNLNPAEDTENWVEETAFYWRLADPASGQWSQITIPDGMYSLSQFNYFIGETLKAAGLWDKDPVTDIPTASPIVFDGNDALGRVTISIKSGWKVSLLSTDGLLLNKWLGFNPPKILVSNVQSTDPPQIFTGDDLPDINSGIMAFNIHCNLVSGSAFSYGDSTDVIATIVPDVPINYSIVYKNTAPIKIPVSSAYREIRDIQFTITDQYDRPITITGDPTVIVLAFHAPDDDGHSSGGRGSSNKRKRI